MRPYADAVIERVAFRHLILRLFDRHFDDPHSALRRLENHLSKVRLPFDLAEQLRELPHPSQPDVETMPSLIYYFVPGSRWGTEKPTHPDPVDPSFTKNADGIGLNMGCPVRLLRALDWLACLSPGDQKQVEANFVNLPHHLATVEELLWLTVWNSPSGMCRGGKIAGASGDIDWLLEVMGTRLYLEAKFRPSDWPRLADKGTFVPMAGSFLGKAAHKFVNSERGHATNVVGITGLDNLDVSIAHQIGCELEMHPQIHAVVFRDFLSRTHVLSLDLGIRDLVWSLLATPNAKDFPVNYLTCYNIKNRDERVAQRLADGGVVSTATSKMFCCALRPRNLDQISMPDDAYRANIVARSNNGEPQFEVIPKYLWPT